MEMLLRVKSQNGGKPRNCLSSAKPDVERFPSAGMRSA